MHSLKDIQLKCNKKFLLNLGGGELFSDGGLLLIMDFLHALASQPAISWFFNRMDDDTLRQFDDIMRRLRKKIYTIQMPEFVLFDIDTTLLAPL